MTTTLLAKEPTTNHDWTWQGASLGATLRPTPAATRWFCKAKAVRCSTEQVQRGLAQLAWGQWSLGRDTRLGLSLGNQLTALDERGRLGTRAWIDELVLGTEAQYGRSEAAMWVGLNYAESHWPSPATCPTRRPRSRCSQARASTCKLASCFGPARTKTGSIRLLRLARPRGKGVAQKHACRFWTAASTSSRSCWALVIALHQSRLAMSTASDLRRNAAGEHAHPPPRGARIERTATARANRRCRRQCRLLRHKRSRLALHTHATKALVAGFTSGPVHASPPFRRSAIPALNPPR